ncbi:MAG: hypothetical protein M3N16_09210 [Actinomycetota bacterium]|nr:hypothetical protein [Actinomycetota bacterium]
MADARRDRIARNEASYRELNEAIASREQPAAGPLMLLCECGYENCTQALHIPVADYEAVRANSRHFLVLEGHEIDDVERVVERRPGWLVVEKPEDAAHIVDPRDPRRSES